MRRVKAAGARSLHEIFNESFPGDTPDMRDFRIRDVYYQLADHIRRQN